MLWAEQLAPGRWACFWWACMGEGSGRRIRPRAAADGHVTQLVSDRALLVASCVLGLVGWLLMVPPSGWSVLFDEAADNADMGLAQFGAAFFLVTVAFPFGRGVCLSMVGKLLGDRPQGAWMGIMFALGAIARIAGPFWAVTGYAWFGSFAVFGSPKIRHRRARSQATQEADCVLIIQNDGELKYLDVKKNRYDGQLGIVPVHFSSFVVLHQPELLPSSIATMPTSSSVSRSLDHSVRLVSDQCQLLQFLPSSRSLTIQRSSPSPSLAMLSERRAAVRCEGSSQKCSWGTCRARFSL